MKKVVIPFVIILFLLVAVLGTYKFIQSKKAVSETPAVTGTDAPPTEEPIGMQNSDQPAVIEPVVKEISLVVSSPLDGATVKSATIVIKGKTVANAEVFINEAETMADASGNFSKSITLDEGDNIIIVMVNDASGNVAEKDLTINYDSGQ